MTRTELLERLYLSRSKAAGMVGGRELSLELGNLIRNVEDGGIQDGEPPPDVNRGAQRSVRHRACARPHQFQLHVVDRPEDWWGTGQPVPYKPADGQW